MLTKKASSLAYVFLRAGHDLCNINRHRLTKISILLPYTWLLLRLLWKNYKTVCRPQISSPGTHHRREGGRNVKCKKKRDVWGHPPGAGNLTSPQPEEVISSNLTQENPGFCLAKNKDFVWLVPQSKTFLSWCRSQFSCPSRWQEKWWW